MNRLIRIMLSFVLPFFCLLISVSYADWTSTPIKNTARIESNYTTTPATFGDYTMATIKTIVKNYMNDSTTYETQYNSMIEYLENMDLALVFAKRGTDSYCFVFPDNIDVGLYSDTNYYFINNGRVDFGTTAYSTYYYGNSTDTTAVYFNVNQTDSLFYSTKSVKKISYANGYYWDGTYIYEVPTVPDEPESPSLPSNAEIASVVQAFYNSDYYKNNKDFSDFMVLYNTTNGNYSFIGHTLGNVLGQVIIPPDYRFEGKLYSEQWWKFYIDENQGATPYASTFHLYSIINTALDVISDDGVGKISELVNLDFSSKSVIVYSTTDYPVRTYMLDETTGDYIYTDGIIEGDQYTYDENLDPTISGYNPLDNFVTVDPSQTIIGDADFEGFTDVFEENKDLFSFTENMQWLIKANNKLSNYFLGFIVMCALFITLGRVLKG